MLFNENTIMTLFYLASRAAPSWYIQLNMFLNNFGAGCPVALPLIAVSASKTCQYHREIRRAKVWDLVQSDQSIKTCYTNRTI